MVSLLAALPEEEASPCPSCRWQESTVHVQLLPTDAWCKGKGLAKEGGLQHSHSLPAIDWLLVPSGIFFLLHMLVRKWEWVTQGCQQGTKGIMLTPVGNNLKGQGARLTFEITDKSLELSILLSIFCHPPDIPSLFWNSCFRKEDSIFTAVLLQLGIRDWHYQCRS